MQKILKIRHILTLRYERKLLQNCTYSKLTFRQYMPSEVLQNISSYGRREDYLVHHNATLEEN